MAELRPGSTLGPYQIQGVLGQGGMATVYLARQPSLDRMVALKVLSGELARDPQFVQRFQREARTAASLEHASIVQIYDVGQADGHFYIAMRYVAGVTLAQLLEREGRLPLDRALRLLTQIASALDYAHHQADPVIHRDLKPGNVLVEPAQQINCVQQVVIWRGATECERVEQGRRELAKMAVALAEQVEIVGVKRARDAFSVVHGSGQLIFGQDLAEDRRTCFQPSAVARFTTVPVWPASSSSGSRISTTLWEPRCSRLWRARSGASGMANHGRVRPILRSRVAYLAIRDPLPKFTALARAVNEFQRYIGRNAHMIAGYGARWRAAR